MTENYDISRTEAAHGQLSHTNNATLSLLAGEVAVQSNACILSDARPTNPNLGGKKASSGKSGVQRMRVLVKAIHDLSNQANNTTLYPTLALYLLSPPGTYHSVTFPEASKFFLLLHWQERWVGCVTRFRRGCSLAGATKEKEQRTLMETRELISCLISCSKKPTFPTSMRQT